MGTSLMGPLLQVPDLKTQFFTQDGILHVVNGTSFDLGKGETVGIVGESGCGKTVSMLSLMRLIPQPPGRIVGGEAWFQGRNENIHPVLIDCAEIVFSALWEDAIMIGAGALVW